MPKAKDLNPHHLCTWDKDSNCKGCKNDKRLHCKWDSEILLGFFLIYIPFGFTSIFGLSVVGWLTRAWWWLIAYIIFCVIFFVFVEIRILCSHCPYYAGPGKILKCHANNGAVKWYKYYPEPMNKFEKLLLLICFAFFGLFPIAAEIYGTWFAYTNFTYNHLADHLLMIGLLISTLLTCITFFGILQIFFCPKCPNFSCPFNRVPKDEKDAYLDKNEVVKKAWEKK